MEYITKSCPHCGYNYAKMQPKGSAYYGSPIRVCKKCGSNFIDRDYIEIALEGVRPVDTQRISGSTIFACSGLLLVGVLSVVLFLPEIIKNNSWSIIHLLFAMFFFGCPAFLLISEYREYEERQSQLKKERIESESRLSNVSYANALKQLGYSVPYRYLYPDE